MKKKIKLVITMILCACMLSACNGLEIEFHQETGYSEDGATDANDLDLQLEQLADIKVIGKYSEKSKTVTCVITAPDLYTYIVGNMDALSKLDTEQLYEVLLDYAIDDKSPQIETELELPVEYYNEKLYVDTSSYEYQDAIHGGLNSALTELFIQSINEMQEIVTE